MRRMWPFKSRRGRAGHQPRKNRSTEAQGAYFADSPITDPSQDRFRRWPFAKRVADTIAASEDSSSLVVGIYGAWGEGKSTVLHFIKHELEHHANIICVWFNPWQCEDETQLIIAYFRTLASALHRSLTSTTEIFGLLMQYAALLVPVNPYASSLQKVGEKLTSIDAEALKKKIETILTSSKKRVVVLVDDIDRLDKTEIHAIFKLVKLTADFAYTSYVLAFDDDMVAKALAERYGSDEAAGHDFLDKIVQVPLHLPPADEASLVEICFMAANEALSLAGITLKKEDANSFSSRFITAFGPRLRTPRMAKRYGNALLFALPILKGEVNPVDLMLVEGMRVFYPKLYSMVRDNPDAVLKSSRDESQRKRKQQLIDEALAELPLEDKDAARELLGVLFPRSGCGLYGDAAYGSDWDKHWAEEQRVASQDYFRRYFSYAIPLGDVSDNAILSLLAGLERRERVSACLPELRAAIKDAGPDRVLTKFIRRAEVLPPETSVNLALAIGEVGPEFPNTETFLSLSPFSRAAALLATLLKNIPDVQQRFDVAKLLIKSIEPLSLAVEFYRWLRASEEGEEATLPKSQEDEIGRVAANRIREYSQTHVLHEDFRKEAPALLYVWAHWGSRQESNDYLVKLMEENPRNAVELLKCYLGTAWGSDSGPAPGDFERMQYDSLRLVVDPGQVLKALSRVYGSALESPRAENYRKGHIDERVAHQFASVHRHVTETTVSEGGSTEESEADQDSRLETSAPEGVSG
ncbi:MAG: P-loop NTPase fold protein [Bacillota bacterium]|nr:P-loop NTPase fold protein [Bacillota bacterium]